MRFAQPELLYGLIVIPALVAWIAWRERARRRDLAAWLDSSVWGSLAAEASPSRRRLGLALSAAALAILLGGAARPQLGTRILETRQKGIDIVLAFDVSLSMEARDGSPTRRERALQEAAALLDRLKGDRIALVSFAGAPLLHSPLTLDRGAIRQLLPLLRPDLASEPGTDIAGAIDRSVDAFLPDPQRGRALILLSDGEAHSGDLERAAAAAREAGVRIFAIGVGRLEGEPIPIRGPGEAVEMKRDRHGNVVITRLEERALLRVCEATGGTYVRAGSGAAARRIEAALRELKEGEVEGGLGIRYEERYAYFAACALGLLLLGGGIGERRRRR